MSDERTLPLTKTEQSVLTTYREVNPSKRNLTGDWWGDMRRAWEHIFFDRLHVPPALFRDAEVLDMGCGTGERTTMYAAWGARVHGIDFNDLALKELTSFAKQHNLADRITTELTAIASWEPPIGKFDFSIAHGVLHHTSDPKASYAKLAAGAKKGGYVIFSTAPMPGGEQRLLMRQIAQRFSRTLDEAVALMMELFPEHIDRSVRLGGRSAVQVVSDNMLAEQNIPLPVEEVLSWLDEFGVALYQSWPHLDVHVSDHAVTPSLPIECLPWRSVVADHARFWASQRYPRAEESDAPETLAAIYESEMGQIAAALELDDSRALRSLRAILPSCKVVGRGTCGLGEWWIVGVKR